MPVGHTAVAGSWASARRSAHAIAAVATAAGPGRPRASHSAAMSAASARPWSAPVGRPAPGRTADTSASGPQMTAISSRTGSPTSTS